MDAGVPPVSPQCGGARAKRAGEAPRFASVRAHARRVAALAIGWHGLWQGYGVRDRKEVFGLTYEKFREAPVNGKCRHTLAHFETGDIRANGFDYAGDLISGHEGYLRCVPIVSGQHHQVA